MPAGHIRHVEMVDDINSLCDVVDEIALGSSAMAGIGAAKKLDKFAGMPSNALGLATATG